MFTRRALVHLAVAVLALLPLAACTGLIAGPASQASVHTALAPDSTYRRARAQLTTEVFSIIEEDPYHHWIQATRFRSATARPNTPLSCRLHLRVSVEGEEVKTTGQWTVDGAETSDKGREVCDQELAAARSRVEKFASNTQ